MKPVLNAFRAAQDTIPFWFMRQAGRYLPEYREIRAKTGNFLGMCYTPEKASEVTLQPVRRFGMSAAIIFSDILVIPDALGVDVRFEEQVGPVLEPVQTPAVLDQLRYAPEKLSPVYEALRRTRAALPDTCTLIGFAGSPWTLACYVVQGKSDKQFSYVREMARAQPAFFSRLINILGDAVAEHCIAQIAAGAEMIQLFDSWAGVLDEAEFVRWVIEPTTAIVEKIRRRCPTIPIIGFPRQAGTKYLRYVQETRVDGVNIDPDVSLSWARDALQPHCLVQGNLDPLLLLEDKGAILRQAEQIVGTLSTGRFIFNLGHGILQKTPVDNVAALCQFLRNHPQPAHVENRRHLV